MVSKDDDWALKGLGETPKKVMKNSDVSAQLTLLDKTNNVKLEPMILC